MRQTEESCAEMVLFLGRWIESSGSLPCDSQLVYPLDSQLTCIYHNTNSYRFSNCNLRQHLSHHPPPRCSVLVKSAGCCIVCSDHLRRRSLCFSTDTSKDHNFLPFSPFAVLNRSAGFILTDCLFRSASPGFSLFLHRLEGKDRNFLVSIVFYLSRRFKCVLIKSAGAGFLYIPIVYSDQIRRRCLCFSTDASRPVSPFPRRSASDRLGSRCLCLMRCRNAQRQSAAAEIIGSNEDLVVEILVLLPLKSVVRFKSVSKTWFSLISGPTFPLLWQKRQRHFHDPKISGLFFTSVSRKQIKYIPLKDTDDVGKSKSLARFPNMYTVDITIIDACNGFLLLCSEPNYMPRSYQVYNPTTKQSQTLPWPFSLATYPRDDPLYLAFDPSKSIHYKVVLLKRLLKRLRKGNGLYQIHVYSSETNAWGTPSDDHYSFPSVDLDNGVYCNGSIHWISLWTDEPSKYFDVDQERLFPMPSSPFPEIDHFGESRGYLYLTGRSFLGTRFDIEVSELERDYSKWSLKYRLNFNMMLNFVSQEMIAPQTMSVLGLIHGKDEGDVFLVLLVGTNMIISYNIKDDTFKKLHDVVHHPGSSQQQLGGYKSCRIHRYIETLLSV
ncbi:F-box protein At5g07610-like isoform X2 [Cornus florida]|uniref:F-box protein At5g07610-like isoform X2 n=1 Tax=Cornus florida TaxID=4283 RepID=UPI00289E74ED|nr:F-box protein At5g07610-like isoform X2 [Cornus florida]